MIFEIEKKVTTLITKKILPSKMCTENRCKERRSRHSEDRSNCQFERPLVEYELEGTSEYFWYRS
jgi:hypothetical protein